MFRQTDSNSYDRDLASPGITSATTVRGPGSKSVGPAFDTAVELARCFLRLAQLPNFALDRLSRYEGTAGRIMYAVDALDRRSHQCSIARHSIKTGRDVIRKVGVDHEHIGGPRRAYRLHRSATSDD
jgi:hypothetical protein